MNIGATMLPQFTPADTVHGERKIFEMLRDDPQANTWIVLHSIDLAQHTKNTQGEADFVILIPDAGIVVLEVKSHKSVRYDGHGWWLGRAAKPDQRGPFKQASQAMHSIRKYLKDHAIRASIPMVSAVAFTDAPFSKKSPEWHTWQVLDRQSLHARSISENLNTIIQNACALYRQKGLNWAQQKCNCDKGEIQKIANFLRPKFEVIANADAKREKLDESLLRCTKQQFHFLDLLCGNKRIIIQGLAGTGKTTLALEATRREKAENSDSSIALFCYNNLLGEKLRQETKTFTKQMRTGTFHQWLLEIADIPYSKYLRSEPNFWKQQLPDRVIEILTSPGVESEFLDLLILDEAQDLFTERYLDIFNLILKGGLENGRWLIFGDFEKQDLYAKGEIPRKSFIEDYAKERCTSFQLDVNCRNTQEISRTVTLLAQLVPAYSNVLREDTRHDPTLLFYEDREQQKELCLIEIEKTLAEGFKAKDIVLLSPIDQRSLANSLRNHPKWKGRLAPYEIGTDKASSSTIHSFKGMEAPVIILTDIENLSDQTKWDLLYTGMSRALHRLVILANGKTKTAFREALL